MTSNQTNELNTSLLANTTIWTRSAAFKAAQQESTSSAPHSTHTNSLNENLIASSPHLNNLTTLTKRNHNHHHFGTHHSSHHHHGHYQHVLGKIVKPIPVRPMSSSSSSSSTHSSLFNSSSSNTNQLAGVLKSINHSSNAATSNLDSANLATTDIEIDSINSSNNSTGNFSLIAKYFASFPATRLKSTTTGNQQTSSVHEAGIHHNVNCPHHQTSSHSPILKSNDLFQTRNHETPTPTITSATVPPPHQTRNRTATFMPFKKSNQHKTQQSTTSPSASNLNELNTYNTDKIQSTFTLRSQSAFNNKIQLQLNQTSNLTINNTDHLCTNFKRMIKLSDNHISHAIESDPASPLTAASNTPTFDSSNLGTNDLSAPFELTNSLNTLTNNSISTNNNNTTFTFPNFDSETSFVLPLNATTNQIDVSSLSASNGDADQSTRFGQITMETRSTRKFLIKHHPYLQLNSNINNNSTNTNKLFNQQRPSINLIKMKKLCSKSTSLKVSEHHQLSDASATVTRASGRVSRSNLVEEDSKLLKFTDTAPQVANLNHQSSYSLRVKNSTSSLNKTTVKSSHKKSSSSSKTSKPASSTNVSNPNQTGKTEEWCCCFNSENYNEANNDYDVNNCFEEYDDDQEEDSSGYYSSYQSVDLVSTSGGGSIVGDKQESKSNDLKPNQNPQQNQPTQTTTTTTQQQVPVPQHHYHTRYLTNFLQQTNSTTTTTTTATSSNLSSPNTRTLTTTPKNPILSSNTTPTTRLRYQQQLAAAAAAAKTSPTNMKHYYASHQATSSRFHEQYQLECDLDLDQIEND